MTEEDLEKAAVDSCVFENDIFNPALTPYYEKGFKDGAKWRINSVWHDVEMQPEDGRLTIVQFGDNKCLICGNNYSEWNEIVKKFGLKRWAYVEDLIPEEEEV